MPAPWSPDAVQAQAVAARTYAAYERAHPLTAHYQICDTTSCQVYGGTTSEHPAANRPRSRPRRRGPAPTTASRRSPSSRRAAAAGPRPARCPTWSPRRTPTTAGPATRTTPGRSSVDDSAHRAARTRDRQPDRDRRSLRATATASGAAACSVDIGRKLTASTHGDTFRHARTPSAGDTLALTRTTLVRSASGSSLRWRHDPHEGRRLVSSTARAASVGEDPRSATHGARPEHQHQVAALDGLGAGQREPLDRAGDAGR